MVLYLCVTGADRYPARQRLYLLPITIQGFLPGADFDYGSLQKREPNLWMVIPLIVLALLSVVLGIFPNPLTEYIRTIVSTVL